MKKYILETCKFLRLHNNYYIIGKDINIKYTFRFINRSNLSTSKLKMHASSPCVKSIKMYNKLPNGIKNKEIFNICSKKLKRLILQKF